MWINIIAVIVSIASSVYLIMLGSRIKLMRLGLTLCAIGIFIGLGLHSLAEFFEASKLFNVSVLLKIMPILVSLGSIIILVGGINISLCIAGPIERAMRIVGSIRSKESLPEPKVIVASNEVERLVSLVAETANELDISKEALKKSNEALKNKMEKIEQFNKLFVGRELRMKELKKEVDALLRKSGQNTKYNSV